MPNNLWIDLGRYFSILSIYPYIFILFYNNKMSNLEAKDLAIILEAGSDGTN
jgi:hypothetical protein